ncbi:MAG: elongation factor Ts [Chloroflexota bacterium]
MACRAALIEARGDIAEAAKILEKKSLIEARKKVERPASQGRIEAYVHTGGRIGALVEVNCETDFVANTDDFKNLVHNLAMQVAAQNPCYITAEEIPEGTSSQPETDCLLAQPFIKDPGKTVQYLISETIARTGENIKIRRFARFELGV